MTSANKKGMTMPCGAGCYYDLNDLTEEEKRNRAVDQAKDLLKKV